MSVHLNVFLNIDRLPDRDTWQVAVEKRHPTFRFDDFSTRDHTGFLPIELDGTACGFEYWLTKVTTEVVDDLEAIIGGRSHVAEFIFHGNQSDGRAAEIAASVLANMTDGIFFDPQSGEWSRGEDVFGFLERQEAESRRAKLAQAEKKWGNETVRRCPECHAPCPEYRKSCWVCGMELGRVQA